MVYLRCSDIYIYIFCFLTSLIIIPIMYEEKKTYDILYLICVIVWIEIRVLLTINSQSPIGEFANTIATAPWTSIID